MPTFRATIDGAMLVIESSAVTGKETVTFDSERVSEKTSYPSMTVHSFNVQRGDQVDVFEGNVIAGLAEQGFVMRKNGLVVAHEP
jgi:hypothetical protein